MGGTAVHVPCSLILTASLLLWLSSNSYATSQGSDVQFSAPTRLAGGKLGTTGRKLHSPLVRKPTVNTPMAERGGQCGPVKNFTCNKQCCSATFWCGNEARHCSVAEGCLEDWGECGQKWVLHFPLPKNKQKRRPDNNSKEAYPQFDKCGPAYDKYCREPMCCSFYGYCNISKDHCTKGCQEGWGACWGANRPDSANNGSTSANVQSASATPGLPPGQIAGIAVSGFTATCAVIGVIIKLVRRRQQGKSIQISVPLSNAPSVGSPFAKVQLGRASRGNSFGSSGSMHSVAQMLRDVAQNVQQGTSSFTAKTGYGSNT